MTVSPTAAPQGWPCSAWPARTSPTDSGPSSPRREYRHSAAAPSPSLLNPLPKAEGGAQQNNRVGTDGCRLRLLASSTFAPGLLELNLMECTRLESPAASSVILLTPAVYPY